MNLTITESLAFTEVYRAAIERQYNHYLDVYFDGNQFKADIVITAIITIGLYWFLGGIYAAIDYFGNKSSWICRYRIESPEGLKTGKISRLVSQIFLNQVITMFVVYYVRYLKYRYFPKPTPVPGLGRFLYEAVMFVLLREIVFYYVHRFLHHPKVYRYLHAQHHEWQNTVAVVGIYAHPVEHLLSNILPMATGPILLSSHGIILYPWQVWNIFFTLTIHSGFHFPLFPSPIFHTFHHWKTTSNYGTLGLLDWFHGTDKSFRNTKYQNWDHIYFSITPPRELDNSEKRE